jgi:hypothetical protein
MTSRRAQRRAAQPRLVQQLPTGDELWQLTTPLGDVLHVLPAIDDAWPPELKNAVARRRRATLSGRCECAVQDAHLEPWPWRHADGSLVYPWRDLCRVAVDLGAAVRSPKRMRSRAQTERERARARQQGNQA